MQMNNNFIEIWFNYAYFTSFFISLFILWSSWKIFLTIFLVSSGLYLKPILMMSIQFLLFLFLVFCIFDQMECISYPSSMFLLKDKSHQETGNWIFYECFTPSLIKLFRDLQNVEAGTMKDIYILRLLQIFFEGPLI